MLTGLVTLMILVAIGPHIMKPLNGWIQKEPIINLFNPGIISIPLGFISAIIGSLLTKDNAKFDYDAFYLKAQTGIVEKKEVFKRSEEHTSELQSRGQLVCRLLL